MKGYSFNIIFSKRCNQKCYYCDVWSQDIKYKTRIDIDKLNEVLNYFPDNSVVRLNGGEPGLLENIEEGVEVILKHPKIKYLVIYSNGYIRYKNFDFINEDRVFYQEHLILDIKDKKINKFYDMDFDSKYKYVIILAENTTKSLLYNYDYYKKIGLFNNNFYFKMLVNKTIDCYNYINLVEELLNKISLDTGRSFDFAKTVIERVKNNNHDLKLKRSCIAFPYNMFIDFETNQIGHCTMVTSKTKTYPLTKQNIERNLKGLLFTEDEACKNCYMYESHKDILKHVLHKEYINYIYDDVPIKNILW
jgi:organic radical activating enzyme